MKKLIAFIVLLIAAGGGWWYYVKYGQPVEKPTIQYATISQGDIVEGVAATGALEPVRRYDVGSQVSGVVKAIYVDYNTIVKEGQLLAEIDPKLLQVQVDIQNANIERQMSDIASQKVQLDDQKKQFERTKSLFERGLQNQQQFEAAELAIKTREAQIGSAEKSLIQARANLESALLNVGYTKIVAPADGVIVERRVDVGQTVQASMATPSFFVLSTPLEKLKLTASVDEAEIGKIRPGMEVRFTVDAYGLQSPFYGQVDAVRLNATNSNNVVTYPVWISVPNPELKLRPAMTASLRIILSTASNVVRIPNTALRFRPNNDIYTALGITAPAPGGGRNQGPGGSPETNSNGSAPRGGRGDQTNASAGGNSARGGGANAQPGQSPAPQGTNAQANPGGGRNRQPGQGGNQAQTAGNQGGANQAGGGRGGNRPTFTAEQMAAMQAQFGRGGAGGRGAGAGNTGRGGNNQGRGGGRGTQPAVTTQSPVDKDATKIDELWAPIKPLETTGNVWKLDETKIPKELTQIRLRLGVSDGTFTQLLSGDVKVGDQVLTSVILPASMRPAANTNPLMQQQNRGGMPGGMGGVQGGGGGGSAPAGGGGGRGGGGGGGRGGN